MSQPTILTMCDAMQAAQDFAGYVAGRSGPADLRRAVQAAIVEVTNAHPWSFLKDWGRVSLQASQSSSTITYDHTGGTYERQLTIAAGTWPSWTNDDDYGAVVKIADALHVVQNYKTSTVLQLDPVLNPGADVAAGTSYLAYPLWYKLPNDFLRFSGPWAEDVWRLGQSVSHSEMLALHRYHSYTGTLRKHCVRAIPELHGVQGLFIWPPADEDESADFMYDRAARQLRYSGLDTNDRVGTVTSSDLTIVTGASGPTVFKGTMSGSLMRFGNTSNEPTGLDGLYPFLYQQTIASVQSTTSLTLSAAIAGAVTGVKYVISDIINLDVVVHETFLACLRKQLAIQRNMKDKGDYLGLYKEALQRAKNADCRDTQIQIMGPPRTQRLRLRDRVTVPAI